MRVLLDTNAYSALVAGQSEVGERVPTNDIWIAAQAMENESELLSADPPFGFVENLSWRSFPSR